jgi:hypothetical protein
MGRGWKDALEHSYDGAEVLLTKQGLSKPVHVMGGGGIMYLALQIHSETTRIVRGKILSCGNKHYLEEGIMDQKIQTFVDLSFTSLRPDRADKQCTSI